MRLHAETLAVAMAAALLVFSFRGSSAADQPYPTQPVRIIFPGSAGSTGDQRTRVLAERLSVRLGQRFMVENKPGAGTTIGSAVVRDAKPDGYTLLSTFTPAFPVGPILYRPAQYDAVTSFTPIAMFSRGSPFLVVNPALPARNLAEFVALAKAKPGEITIGHGGLGGANHLPAELFGGAAGVRFLFVPYKGETQAMTDVIGGQVSAMFAYSALAVPQILAGKVRALALASATRYAPVAQVPTVAESGYPGFEFHGIMLLLGPAGLPGNVVSTLSREIQAILQEPDVRAIYAASGSDPVFGSPDEVGALIRREIEVNGRIVRELGISLQ